MKTTILMLWLLIAAGSLSAQQLNPYPIPSYDVPVDDREWGVYVVTDDEILVDVWITS